MDDANSLAARAASAASQSTPDAAVIAELVQRIRARAMRFLAGSGSLYRRQKRVEDLVADAISICAAEDYQGIVGTEVAERAKYLLERSLQEYLSTKLRQPTVTERVQQAFKDQESPEFTDRFLQSILDDMKDTAQAERKSAVLAIIVALAFELIGRASVDFQLGPFRVRNLSLIERALPVLFAFLIYDLAALGVRYWYCRQVASELLQISHWRIWGTGLNRLLYPHASSLYGALWLPVGGRLDNLATWLSRMLALGAVSTPVAIEIYAFVRLFSLYGARDGLVWASLTLSAGFVAFAIVLYLAARRAAGFALGLGR